MPRTPDEIRLVKARDEAALLEREVSGTTVLMEDQATFDSVTQALPRHRRAHFACHARSDLTDPSASCLLLYDHESRALTVHDITALRLDQELAFLSACTTARPGVTLPDESIHLAAAFNLAGYRHVIATLWPIRDSVALKFATSFYTSLSGECITDALAYRLQQSTHLLRAESPRTPSAWAPHIHIGP